MVHTIKESFLDKALSFFALVSLINGSVLILCIFLALTEQRSVFGQA